MEAGAKASTPVADAATVSIAERRASEDSQPPAGASGWEHDDVEVVGDEAAVAIDALILLASPRSSRDLSKTTQACASCRSDGSTIACECPLA